MISEFITAGGERATETVTAYVAALEQLPTAALCKLATEKTRAHFGATMSYSPKVFIPLTKLCRDVCHYCTFAKSPRHVDAPFLSLDAVLAIVREGEKAGCHEALFTLGEQPELRYRVAREWLQQNGFNTTLDYVVAACRAVFEGSRLLPHVNAGTMSRSALRRLKPYVASIGIMIESSDSNLIVKGAAHYGSPDKLPFRRLATLVRAGQLSIPTTTGLLLGIGENPRQRIYDLMTIARLHARYGHIQEVIIQNFRAKPGTKMAAAPEISTDELCRTVAFARLVLPASVSVQVPPNLNNADLDQLVAAGINDWGGISPVTPDHVNPESPWPAVRALREECARHGLVLKPRLPIYQPYIESSDKEWLAPSVRERVLGQVDATGLVREDDWRAGSSSGASLIPASAAVMTLDRQVARIIDRRMCGGEVNERELTRLFMARDADLQQVVEAADKLRQAQVGDTVTYVVNRNINYTNVCQYTCNFCAFSKGLPKENGRDRPYDITGEELRRRAVEAWDLGATEVCLQGGIHPGYTGDTYLSIVSAVKSVLPSMHVHAFSPLEIHHGASTLGLSVRDYLTRLRAAGLDTMPGTAAEILDDRVRRVICPDKLNTEEWLAIMATAHEVGVRTTATMMFGHVETCDDWARHLLHIRRLQQQTGGFTEFVPLPFVAGEAPLARRGQCRPGPTRREVVLVHALARLILGDVIPNVQASWVKLGLSGALDALRFGVNDLGGCLMNESISRAAGAGHGQCWAPIDMETAIKSVGRQPRLRTTLYGQAPMEQELKWRSRSLILASTRSDLAHEVLPESAHRTF